MKKNLGILRNKINIYNDTKQKIQRKKNRFQMIGKQSQDINQRQSRVSQVLLTSTSINSTLQDKPLCQDIYLKAKKKLAKAIEIQNQISIQSKARLISFKESDNQRYDQTIAKLASQATNNLLDSQKYLRELKVLIAQNIAQKKIISNIEISLAQQIREVSRNLRQQQKDHFDRIRMYQKHTINPAIQLTPQQRKSMKQLMQQTIEEDITNRDQNIQQLVKSINKLSTIYKQLNQLVIQQGSLIDRIDVNIQQTYQHTQKAVVHLEAADNYPSSPFADNFIKILVIMILFSATLLGIKYMNNG